MDELREKLAELCYRKQREWVEWAWCSTPNDLERSRVDASLPFGEAPSFELVAYTWADEVLALVRGAPEDTSWRAAAVLLRKAAQKYIEWVGASFTRDGDLVKEFRQGFRDALRDTDWMDGTEKIPDSTDSKWREARWISVEDRLPEKYQVVWMVTPNIIAGNTVVALGRYWDDGRSPPGWWTEDGKFHCEVVTHWLPLGLPEVPK